jgi:hypothetical protein
MDSQENTVYLLWWMPQDKLGNLIEGFDNGDCSLIGVYSLQSKAEEALTRAKNLPGFKDYPDGFVIDGYVLDEDHWTSGFAIE